MPERRLRGLLAALSALVGMAVAARAEPGDPQRAIVHARTVDEFEAIGLHHDVAQARARMARDRIQNALSRHIESLDLYVVSPNPGQTRSEMVRAFRATGDYSLVEHDELVTLIGGPDDPFFNRQWHLERINALPAWRYTTGSSSIVCAFVDTGVDLAHPDLAPLLVGGYNAISRLAQADGGAVSDVHGHGTATAGTAAAAGNNATGIVGVGWCIPIMPIRASDTSSGSAYMSDILDGAAWAVEHGARVINVSYAGFQSPTAQYLGAWVRMNNGLLIWPADNSALRYTGFDWPDVLVVSGATREDTMAAFSSYGPAIDLCAPAVSIFTSQRGGTYTWQAGNSFAGPLVAGTAAMIWSMDPWLNSWQVERALITSTDDLGPPGRDECFGHGRLNLAQAIRLGSRTDFNRDGSIDFFDYDDFLIGFDRGDRRADINLDGTVDFFDYDWFIGLFMGL